MEAANLRPTVQRWKWNPGHCLAHSRVVTADARGAQPHDCARHAWAQSRKRIGAADSPSPSTDGSAPSPSCRRVVQAHPEAEAGTDQGGLQNGLMGGWPAWAPHPEVTEKCCLT